MSNPYTNKNFTNQDLSDRSDMDGIDIEGMCLYQEQRLAVLPPTLTGTTFYDCNLDNVILPAGATLVRCSHRWIAVQEDGLDWELDEQGNPIKILGT